MDSNTNIQFYKFGKHMHIAAIAAAISLIPPITPFTGLIAQFFIFSALGDIKTINYQLLDPYLELFRKDYIRGFVTKVFGVIFLFGGAIVLGINLGIPPVAYKFWVIGLPITITIMVTGLIFHIIGSAIEMRAWENLKIYFMTNKLLFPEHMRHKLIDGCDNLRTGALLWALGIFIVTAIIGWILQAVGFFKLAKLDNLIYYEQNEPHTKIITPQASTSITMQPDITSLHKEVFCYNCGSKLDEGGKFCQVCGSQI